MFNHQSNEPHASGYGDDPYGFSHQPWARFDIDQAASSSSVNPSQSDHGNGQQFDPSSDMDWAPTQSDVQASYQHNNHGGPDVELESMSSMQTGGGVGRLVAHFENKGFNPFENKDYAPPLPPRRSNNVQTPHTVARPHQFENLGYFGGGHSSASSFNPNRIATPITSPGESQWGSFGMQSRVMSPVATSSPGMPFASFQNASRVASPGVGPSSEPFRSLDDFLSGGRVQSPVAPSPMSSQMPQSPMMASPMVASPTQSTPQVSGTPGFEIWRPPGSVNVKSEQPQPSNPITNQGGYFKPPVPTTPKPAMNAGNQFILEFNPSAKAKGKAPAKPPRPRPLPPVPPPFSPEVKQEPSTPQPSEGSSSSTPLPVSIMIPCPSVDRTTLTGSCRRKGKDRFLSAPRLELDRHGNRFLLRLGSNSSQQSEHSTLRRGDRSRKSWPSWPTSTTSKRRKFLLTSRDPASSVSSHTWQAEDVQDTIFAMGLRQEQHGG